MGFNSMGNGRLNILNDPVLNVLTDANVVTLAKHRLHAP